MLIEHRLTLITLAQALCDRDELTSEEVHNLVDTATKVS
jgi:hypothetical protein